jgi:hypothetical protein
MHLNWPFNRRSHYISLCQTVSTHAIIFINSASKRIPDKDLEKQHTTRKIAASEGIAALAEWNKENNKDAKKTFEDQKTWNYFKEMFTKTSVEGFVVLQRHCILCQMEKRM